MCLSMLLLRYHIAPKQQFGRDRAGFVDVELDALSGRRLATYCLINTCGPSGNDVLYTTGTDTCSTESEPPNQKATLDLSSPHPRLEM